MMGNKRDQKKRRAGKLVVGHQWKTFCSEKINLHDFSGAIKKPHKIYREI